MLSEIYIEALSVDGEQAEQVWEAWDKGEIDEELAWLAWWLIAFRRLYPESGSWADTMVRGRW